MPSTHQTTAGQSWLNLLKTHQPRLILAVSFILGLAFYYCFWNQLPGISVLVYFGFTTTAVWLFSWLVGRVWGPALWMVTSAIGLLAVCISTRTSEPMLLLNGLGIFALGLVAVWLLGGGPWRMLLSNYLALALLPVFWIMPFLRTLMQVFVPAERQGRYISEAAVRGLVLTIPIVFVLSLLFIGSDARLGALVGNLFTFSLSAEFVAAWLLIISVTVWFMAALAYVIKEASPELRLVRDIRFVGSIESRIMLGGVVAVFGLYLLSQAFYLFGGERYLADNAITYAEYARQGFAQLVFASLIALGVIWAAKPYVPDGDVWLKRLGTVLCCLVLIILASAAWRLWLYDEAYGFTHLRLFAHAFMIWLATLLVIVLLQIWQRIDGYLAGPAMIGAAIVVLLGVNMMNPDVFIARQNIARFHEIGKIDMNYIRVLSDDAIPEVVELLESEDARLRKEVSQMLMYRRGHRGEDALNAWQSWNPSRQRAEKAIDTAKRSNNYNPYGSGSVFESEPAWQD